MVDRAALHPGRVKLVPVEGAANTFDMTRADEPIQAGTPLNKGTLLSEPVASKLGLGGSATPSDALNALVDKKANKQQSADDAGKYWKIGTDGSLEFGTPVAKFSQGPLIITTSQTLDLSQYGLKIGDQINVICIGAGGGGGGGVKPTDVSDPKYTGGGLDNRARANNGCGYGAGGGGGAGKTAGGGGGACGTIAAKTITLTDTSVAVTIGTMGSGGWAVEISSGYNAGNGGNGGTTSFGAYLSAAGGEGGAGVRNFSSGTYSKGAGATGQHNGGNGGNGSTIVGGGGGAGGWIVESITVFSGTDGSDASSDGTDGAGGTPNGLANAGDGAVFIWW